jgi:hypothetical protein
MSSRYQKEPHLVLTQSLTINTIIQGTKKSPNSNLGKGSAILSVDKEIIVKGSDGQTTSFVPDENAVKDTRNMLKQFKKETNLPPINILGDGVC